MTATRRIKSGFTGDSLKSLRALPANEQLVLRKIDAIRRHKRLRLLDVAKHCNTTPQTIQRLLTGGQGMTLKWFFTICDAMNISPSDLFKNNDKQQSLSNQFFEINRNLGLIYKSFEDFEKSIQTYFNPASTIIESQQSPWQQTAKVYESNDA